MKRSAIIGWCFITAVNLLLIVLIGLVFVRFAPPKDNVTQMRSELLLPMAEDVVMRFQPNLKDEEFLHHQPFTVDLEYPKIRLSTNSLGFRDVEHTRAKAMDTIRLVLSGDSYMFATNMDQENTPRDQLQRGLNEIRSTEDPYHYEVLNFGLPGLNLEGMVRVNEHYALDYDPDVVIYSHICDDLSAIDVSTWYHWVQVWTPRLSFLPEEMRSYVLGPVLSGVKELLYKIDDFWEYRTSGYIDPDAASLERYETRMHELLEMVWALRERVEHKVYLLDYCGNPLLQKVVKNFNQSNQATIKTIDLRDIELDHTEHPTVSGIDKTVARLVPIFEKDAQEILVERRSQLLKKDGRCARGGYEAPECMKCLPDRAGESCESYRFKELSCGGHHCCGVLEGGALQCWGAGVRGTGAFPHYGQAVPLSGRYQAVSVGLYHSCALNMDGRVRCWGRDQASLVIPEERFAKVSAGDRNSCGIRGDGRLQCWGEAGSLLRDVPDGIFSDLSLGGDHACALSTGGALRCWGDSKPKLASEHEEPLLEISSGRRSLCGRSAKGQLICFDSANLELPGEEITTLDAGGHMACGITNHKGIRCWGYGVEGYSPPPSGLYQKVDVGLHHACGLTIDGRLRCWGHEKLRLGELDVPKPEDS